MAKTQQHAGHAWPDDDAQHAQQLRKLLRQRNRLSAVYVCPMDPEVRESKPGACPKCGMALEPETLAAPATRIEYVCPMHPEIVRDEPGSCPICGMALEPRTVTLEDAPNPELVDMTRRFWISAALSLPLFIAGDVGHAAGPTLAAFSSRRVCSRGFSSSSPRRWCSGAAGRSIERGWHSIVNRSLNMFTLDRHRRGRGLSVQRRGNSLPGYLSGIILWPQRHRCGLLRGGGDHHHPGAAGSGARAARAQPNQQRDQSSSRAIAEDRPIDSPRRQRRRRSVGPSSKSAIACEFAPARKFRLTASSLRARLRSMNRWSPASQFRSKNPKEAK